MYVYSAGMGDLTSTVQSVEIDLDLPRGYIAKIHKCIFFYTDITADQVYDIEMALVNDPDDTQSTVIPANTVKHDVIAQHLYRVKADQVNGVFYFTADPTKIIDFGELDVIAARNMRFNCVDKQNQGDHDVACEIYYTIEKIKGSENLLNLLDIL